MQTPADQPKEMPSPVTGESPQPAKKPFRFKDVTGAREGGDIQIIGWDVPGRKPPPVPEDCELRKVSESTHRYPDVPQPPTKEQFANNAVFEQAKANWIERYAATVVRRNKYSRPRPKPEGN